MSLADYPAHNPAKEYLDDDGKVQDLPKFPWRALFTSRLTHDAERNGSRVEVLGREMDTDFDVMLYRVRFTDGHLSMAWPEEVSDPDPHEERIIVVGNYLVKHYPHWRPTGDGWRLPPATNLWIGGAYYGSLCVESHHYDMAVWRFESERYGLLHLSAPGYEADATAIFLGALRLLGVTLGKQLAAYADSYLQSPGMPPPRTLAERLTAWNGDTIQVLARMLQAKKVPPQTLIDEVAVDLLDARDACTSKNNPANANEAQQLYEAVMALL